MLCNNNCVWRLWKEKCCGVSPSLFFRLFVFYFHICDTGIKHAQFRRCFFRKIDDPAGSKRASVIDAHFHRAAVGHIDNFYAGTKRKRFMGCRQVSLPECFSAGGAFPIEGIGVIGSLPILGNLTATRSYTDHQYCTGE